MYCGGLYVPERCQVSGKCNTLHFLLHLLFGAGILMESSRHRIQPSRRIDVKKGAKLIVSDPMQLSEGENVALLEICAQCSAPLRLGTYHPSYCRHEPLEPHPFHRFWRGLAIMKLTTARLVELPQDICIRSMMLTHCVLFL